MTSHKLRSLAERAFKWSALTTAGRFGLQLVAQIVLARLLGPDNYGVYGIGMVILTFAAFLSGNAFSYNLMLQKDVHEDDVRFAFTWQVLAGVFCTAGMYLSAGTLAGFFGDLRVEPMVQWMSFACLLSALAGPSTCLLQRELNFRALGLIQLAGYGIGYLGVGIPMALSGYGAQALAAACLVQAAVTLVASFAVHPHSVRPMLRHRAGAATMDTGRTVFFTNIVNWLLTNLERIIIGRVLNAQAVGLYSVAYNIASIPYTLLVGALQPAFLATGARLQDDRGQLARAWMTMLACAMVLLLPAAVTMALLAPDLVLVVYGTAWAESGWVMAIMFLCLPAWACWGLSTPVLWNTGRKHLEIWLQVPVLAIAVPVWWLVAPYGLRALAVASALVVLLRAVLIVSAGMRALGIRWASLWPFAWRGCLLAGVCSLSIVAGHEAAAPFGSNLLTLLAGGTFAALASLTLIAIRPDVLGDEARAVLARFIPAVGPGWRSVPEARP